MKVFIVLLISMMATASMLAQPGNRGVRSKKPDSLNLVKQPAKPVKEKYANPQTNYRQNKAAGNGANNTKLDDLKNPFDTSKVIQRQPSNFSFGASNPTTGQNQRRRRKVNNTKLDDLKNPFDTSKKVMQRQPSNLSFGASNPTSGQNQRRRRTVNNTKLDDLKNPYDTSKKVMQPVNAATQRQKPLNPKNTGNKFAKDTTGLKYNQFGAGAEAVSPAPAKRAAVKPKG
jgi:hypothetical protein